MSHCDGKESQQKYKLTRSFVFVFVSVCGVYVFYFSAILDLCEI